jgi:glycosyltransferase involved in cell wall biosynthesis
MISVVVCTYNRSESLTRTLQSFKEMSVSEELPWELIVVDNNSKDSTEQVIREFAAKSRVNVRYVFEKRQGLSFARNAGVSAAEGEIIAFTDDDVMVGKDWLGNISRCFENSDIACAGGKILPIWEKACPQWLVEELHRYLALLDLGDREKQMDKPCLWGANIAIRSMLFEKYGKFDTEMGRKGGKLYAGEEVRFVGRLLQGGERVIYHPDIVVHHFIPARRLRKSYFRKWKYDQGELHGVQMGYFEGRSIGRVPLYAVRDLLKRVLRYLRVQLFNPQAAFIEELSLIYILGFIAGRLRSL